MVTARAAQPRGTVAPEGIAFAAHYGFRIALAQRPQFGGRAERQVRILRRGVLTGGASREWTRPRQLAAESRAQVEALVR